MEGMIRLNRDIEMPALGTGTLSLTDPDICEQVMLECLRNGCRMIDTSQMGHNEKYIGRALRNSGLDRGDLFLCSRIWPAHYIKSLMRRSVEKSLSHLGIDHFDLLLLQAPIGDWKQAWKELEALADEGLTRAVGVSNFIIPHLFNEFEAFANIPPAVDQVECHPLIQHKALEECLKKTDTVLEACMPLGHGSPLLFNNGTLVDLSQKYRKSVAQVILRWHIQCGHAAIPRSSDPRHIRGNANIYNFKLSSEDMELIGSLDRSISCDRCPKPLRRLAYRFMR